MPVDTQAEKGIIIVVPSEKYKPYRKVVVNGTDVSSYVKAFQVEPGSSGRAGTFKIELDNDDGRYTGVFDKNQIVTVYIDYTGTLDNNSIRIEGRVDTPEYSMDTSGYVLSLTGRCYMVDALKVLIYEDYSVTPTAASTVVQYLITTYLAPLGHSVDFSLIANVTTLIDNSWNGVPLMTAFTDIIERLNNNYGLVCNHNKIWRLYQKGTWHSNLVISQKDNMLGIRHTDGSLLDLKNRTWLQGRTTDGVPVLYRADDATSQAAYGAWYTSTEDNNLVTNSQVKDTAIAKNSITSTLEPYGTVYAVGIPELQNGQTVLIINPYCRVQGLKNAVGVAHSWTLGGFITTVNYESFEQGIVDLIIEREKGERRSSTVNNIHGMTRSHTLNFKDENYGVDGIDPDTSASLESMTRCVVWDNNLMMQLLETDGNCTSRVHVADANISQILINKDCIAGSNFESDEDEAWLSFKVSIDNGISWKDISWSDVENGMPITPNSSGKRLKIKIYFTSLTTKIKAMSILYKCVGQ